MNTNYNVQAIKGKYARIQNDMTCLTNKLMTEYYTDTETTINVISCFKKLVNRRKLVKKKIQDGVPVPKNIRDKYDVDLNTLFKPELDQIEYKYKLVNEDMKKLLLLVNDAYKLCGMSKLPNNFDERINMITKHLNRPLENINLFAASLTDEDFKFTLLQFTKRIQEKNNIIYF